MSRMMARGQLDAGARAWLLVATWLVSCADGKTPAREDAAEPSDSDAQAPDTDDDAGSSEDDAGEVLARDGGAEDSGGGSMDAATLPPRDAAADASDAGHDAGAASACGAVCSGGLTCDPLLKKCCACSLGDSECRAVIGSQRICVAGADGCGSWSEYGVCGAAGCGSDMKRCAVASGIQVDQWGEGQLDEIHALAAPGNVIVAGYSNGKLDGQTGSGDLDLFVSARARNGAGLWTKLAGTASYDSADGLVVDGDGNMFVAGETEGKLGAQQYGSRDAYVSKLRPDRSLEWTTQFGSSGSERVTDLARDTAGNLFVSGWTTGALSGSNAGMYDMFVSKLGPSGNLLWSVQRGTSADDLAIQLATDGDGNVFVVGSSGGALSSTDTALGLSDIILIKINAGGSVQWIRQWGSGSDDGGLDIATHASGDLVVAGYTRGDLPSATGRGGGFLARLDPSGAPRWVRLLGAVSSDGANRLSVVDDVIYTTGVTLGEAVPGQSKGMRDVFVAATKLDGSPLWLKQVGTDQNDEPLAIAVGSDKTVYVGGATSGSFPGFSLQGIWDNFLITIRPE